MWNWKEKKNRHNSVGRWFALLTHGTYKGDSSAAELLKLVTFSFYFAYRSISTSLDRTYIFKCRRVSEWLRRRQRRRRKARWRYKQHLVWLARYSLIHGKFTACTFISQVIYLVAVTETGTEPDDYLLYLPTYLIVVRNSGTDLLYVVCRVPSIYNCWLHKKERRSKII